MAADGTATLSPAGYAPRHRSAVTEPDGTGTGGIALSSVRSLRVMRSAALDLRPATSITSMAPAGTRMPALPGFGRRPSAAGAPPEPTQTPQTPQTPQAAQTTQTAQAAAPGTVSPGTRLAALAMPDQLALRRSPRYAATRTGTPTPEQPAGLGSGFAPDRPIVPATTSGAGATTVSAGIAAPIARRTPAPGTAPHARPGAHSLPARTPFHAEPPVPPSIAALALPLAPQTTASPGGTTSGTPVAPAGPAAPPVAAASTFRGAGTTNDAGQVALRRALTTAPPRISIRPAAPLPASQLEEAIRRTAAPDAATSAAADTARSSLLARAADMIRSFNGEHPSTSSTTQGGPMSDVSRSDRMAMSSPTLRRSLHGVAADEPQTYDQYLAAQQAQREAEDEAALIDRITDTVVERIEQRVIDELERRGRRAHPGGF